MQKINIALFFGGRSGEYRVSLASAAAVLRGLDPDRYAVTAVGLTHGGRWLATDATPDEIEADRWQKAGRAAFLSPDRGKGGLYIWENGVPVWQKIHVLFPVMHGAFGEDGCMAGLFALSPLPFVGCEVAAAAAGMDKAATKRLAAAIDIPCLPHLLILPDEDGHDALRRAAAAWGFPLFIKPVTGGSSLGARVLTSPADLPPARRGWRGAMMLEPYCPAREIEVGVLSLPNGMREVSLPGEIGLPGAGFYDYEQKYKKGEVTLEIPARIDEETTATCRRYAEKIYRHLGCRGPVRVDFFLTKDGTLYLNEVNTLPGFTAGSMYPRLMTQDRSFSDLLDLLIAGARRG